MTDSPTYRSWSYMHCRVKGVMSNPAYYRDKGITVCERWKSFENFFADMGERLPGYTLDRINADGNYEPSNCRWATKAEQAVNKSNTVWLEFNGERRCVADWSRITGLGKATIFHRLRRGWPVQDVLNCKKNFRYVKNGVLHRMKEAA